MILYHARPVQRLEHTLVAGLAVGLRHVASGPEPIGREHLGDRLHVLIVDVTNHPDTVPSRSALRRAGIPFGKRSAVVAVGAIDPECRRHVSHQAVGPLGIFDRVLVTGRQSRRTMNADLVGAQQERCEGVLGQ